MTNLLCGILKKKCRQDAITEHAIALMNKNLLKIQDNMLNTFKKKINDYLDQTKDINMKLMNETNLKYCNFDAVIANTLANINLITDIMNNICNKLQSLKKPIEDAIKLEKISSNIEYIAIKTFFEQKNVLKIQCLN